MAFQVNQGLPYGLPAPGLPSRNNTPSFTGTGAVTLTQTPTSVTISVGQLAVTNGGLQTTNFNAASNTRYFCEGSGITATAPASPAQDDVIIIAVGASPVTFSPNGNKVNGQTSSLALNPYNTYIMTYGTTSGWC